SAAVRLFNVRRPKDGGESMMTKSYASRTGSSMRRSRNSRDMAVTSSISAPASSMVAGATHSVSMAVGRRTLSNGSSCTSTSYMHCSQAALSTPAPLVALPCGSRSIKSTLAPSTAKYAAKLTAVVLFPTPPFWFTMAMTRPMNTLLLLCTAHRQSNLPALGGGVRVYRFLHVHFQSHPLHVSHDRQDAVAEQPHGLTPPHDAAAFAGALGRTLRPS